MIRFYVALCIAAFLLPAAFALFQIISNPTIDIVAEYIENLVTNYVYLVVDIPGLIAGLVFGTLIEPVLKKP